MTSLIRRLPSLSACLLAILCVASVRAQTAGGTCATAGVIVTNGSYSFDTTGASPNDPCASIPTVWYRYTAPSAGTIDADLCGSSYNTFLTVFPGNTCSLTCDDAIVWNDNSAGCAPGNQGSRLSFDTAGGQSFYFVISGWTPGSFGAGVFNFTFTPSGDVLAGDTCAAAGVLVEDGSYPFNTTGKSANNPCDLGGSPTVWYKFTPLVDGTVYADLCGSGYDTFLTVFRGPSCPLACNNVVSFNDNSCGPQSAVSFTGFSGVAYLIAVSGANAGAFGPGVLNLSFAPFSGLAGDTCLNPHILAENGNYPYNTVGASPDEPCVFGISAPTVWFKYEAPSHGTVTASACPGGAATFNVTLVAHVTNGACPVNCETSVDATSGCGLVPGEYGVQFSVQTGDVVYMTVSSPSVSAVGSGLLAFAFTPGGPPSARGDINGDGVVNVADVTELSNLLRAGTPPPLAVGDLNEDDSVDEDDRDILADAIVNE